MKSEEINEGPKQATVPLRNIKIGTKREFSKFQVYELTKQARDDKYFYSYLKTGHTCPECKGNDHEVRKADLKCDHVWETDCKGCGQLTDWIPQFKSQQESVDFYVKRTLQLEERANWAKNELVKMYERQRDFWTAQGEEFPATYHEWIKVRNEQSRRKISEMTEEEKRFLK